MTEEQQGNRAELNELVKRFIDLANEMKNSGKSAPMVSAALMSASGIYATYASAGNKGYLKEGGVTKITEVYRRTLMNVQRIKKAEVETEMKQEQTAPGEGGG